ncbi:MAG: TIGR00730 family Rossman fold protein, partial [Actinomycetes bacterium]
MSTPPYPARPEGQKKRLCVFCSSSDAIDPKYLDLAKNLGTAMVARNIDLVSGGGSVSMMGAIAGSVRAGGGHTVGVIPRGLLGWDVADADADELYVTGNMRDRKDLMDANSDAFMALPGGLGTLEELIEAWTGRTLG